MKLEYEEIEDSYDDTTKIRTMTEQAIVKKKGVLLRTTVYSPPSTKRERGLPPWSQTV